MTRAQEWVIFLKSSTQAKSITSFHKHKKSMVIVPRCGTKFKSVVEIVIKNVEIGPTNSEILNMFIRRRFQKTEAREELLSRAGIQSRDRVSRTK